MNKLEKQLGEKPMTQAKILEKYEALPESLKTEVGHYIEFLLEKYVNPTGGTRPKGKEENQHETVTTRGVDIDIADISIEEVKNRVVDPSKTMNRQFFAGQLEAFLNAEDKSSEGIGREVIEARLNKWASLKETLRRESGGKKKVAARKAQIRSLAEVGTPEAIEELKEVFKELNQMAEDGEFPHWTAGVVAGLLKDVNASLGHDLYEDENQHNLEKSHGYGSWAGQIIMSDDFDEPLEDLKDYM
jgi:Protein of unknown function (DUF2281)